MTLNAIHIFVDTPSHEQITTVKLPQRIKNFKQNMYDNISA